MPERSITHYAEDVFAPPLARTTSGDSGMWTGFGRASTLRVQLNVTAASGTSPSLAVFVEDSFDGTTWNQIAAFAAKTAAGVEVVNISTPFTDRVRVRWAITGTTPSFTFSVVAASQTVDIA